MLIRILAFAQSVPDLIDFQGKITDDNGNLINGPVSLEFNIYDVETGGLPLWTETQNPVFVSNGYFHVFLGAVTTVPDSLFNAPGRWVGINVNNDGEMTPRTRLGSMPYSIKSGNGNPVGSIQPFAGESAPAGWLICDGSEINRNEYRSLFDIIGEKFGSGNGTTTFNLPDFRGEFLRGWDNGRGRDPDALSRNGGDNIGSTQDDAFQGHGHNIWLQFGNAAHPNYPPGGQYSFVGNDPNYGPHGGKIINPTSIGSFGSPRYTSETRPKNVYVNFIIKY